MMDSGGRGPPDPREEVEKRREAAKAFFNGKGSISLLCELLPYEEKSFDELNDDVSVTRATLSDRLTEAQDAGILEATYRGSEYGTTKVYKYTKLGQQLRQKVRDNDFERLYRKIQTLGEEMDEKKSNLRTWVTEDLISPHPSEDRNRDPDPPR
jgi:DNA-binding HxlR family transcriptional regulator